MVLNIIGIVLAFNVITKLMKGAFKLAFFGAILLGIYAVYMGVIPLPF